MKGNFCINFSLEGCPEGLWGLLPSS